MVSSRFLIINADDLGISPEVNHGICAAYEQGLVTDSSLLPKGPYSHEAIHMIKENAGFPVGIHIDLDFLLGWESPGKEKFTRRELDRMMNNANFVQRVKEEIHEQIEVFLGAGLIPSHIDTHHHVHGFPQIFEPLLEAMDRHAIKALRFSKKGYFLLGREEILVAEEMAQWMEDALRERDIAYPQLLIDPLVPFSLQELPSGVTELMVHPSMGGDPWRQRDFEMLVDPLFMTKVRDEGIQLIGFTEIDIR